MIVPSSQKTASFEPASRESASLISRGKTIWPLVDIVITWTGIKYSLVRKSYFVFRDSGQPFNPLDKPDPNITANSDEHEIGGLGICMVKNIMDEVTYEYADNHNVLTLVKNRKF